MFVEIRDQCWVSSLVIPHFNFSVCVFVSVCVHELSLCLMCRSEEILWVLFLSFTLWILGIDFRLSGLAANTSSLLSHLTAPAPHLSFGAQAFHQTWSSLIWMGRLTSEFQPTCLHLLTLGVSGPGFFTGAGDPNLSYCLFFPAWYRKGLTH